MQRAGDARALERLRGGVFGAGRHQARHFGLGDGDFLAAAVGEADVGDGVIGDALLMMGASAGSLLESGRPPSKAAAAIAINI